MEPIDLANGAMQVLYQYPNIPYLAPAMEISCNSLK